MFRNAPLTNFAAPHQMRRGRTQNDPFRKLLKVSGIQGDGWGHVWMSTKTLQPERKEHLCGY